MKKILFPLLASVLMLSACTTPVSKLDTMEQQSADGRNTAWESEQDALAADPWDQHFQEGVPIFSELQSKVVRATPIFGDPDSGDNADEMVMGMSGIFHPRSYTAGNGEQEVINDSISVTGETEAPGIYRLEFGCWGTGQASLQVFTNIDFPDPDEEPSASYPLTCSVPAAVMQGQLEIAEGSSAYHVMIVGDANTIGSYEFNVYQPSEG